MGVMTPPIKQDSVKKKHRDWFDEIELELSQVLKNRSKTHNKYLSYYSLPNGNKWKVNQAETQRRKRRVKIEQWLDKEKTIPEYANEGKVQKFHEAIRRVYGPRIESISVMRDVVESNLLEHQSSILARFGEYLAELLNCSIDADITGTNRVPQHTTIEEMDFPSTVHKVKKSISAMKSYKAKRLGRNPRRGVQVWW